MSAKVMIATAVSECEAEALAQFMKRLDREDCRRFARDQAEADAMFEGFVALREALRAAGCELR